MSVDVIADVAVESLILVKEHEVLAIWHVDRELILLDLIAGIWLLCGLQTGKSLYLGHDVSPYKGVLKNGLT